MYKHYYSDTRALDARNARKHRPHARVHRCEPPRTTQTPPPFSLDDKARREYLTCPSMAAFSCSRYALL